MGQMGAAGRMVADRRRVSADAMMKVMRCSGGRSSRRCVVMVGLAGSVDTDRDVYSASGRLEGSRSTGRVNHCGCCGGGRICIWSPCCGRNGCGGRTGSLADGGQRVRTHHVESNAERVVIGCRGQLIRLLVSDFAALAGRQVLRLLLLLLPLMLAVRLLLRVM